MKNAVFLIFFPVILACLRQDAGMLITKHEDAITVKLSNPKVNFDTLSFSDYSIEQHVIKLQTSETNLIGQIDEVIAVKDYLFILDSRVSKKVYQFDKYGDFMRIIGSFGDGPGEYTQPEDISYDSFNDLLIVFANQQRKVIAYSLTEGSFVFEEKLSFNANEIQPVGENKYLVFNHDSYNPPIDTYEGDLNYNLLIFDKDFSRPTSKFFKTNAIANEGKSVYKNGRYLIQDGDFTHVSWRFNDTNYVFFNDTIYSSVIFDFDEKAITWSSYEETSANHILPKLMTGAFSSQIKPVIFANDIFLTQFVAIENPNKQIEDQIFIYLGTSTTGVVFQRLLNDYINLEIPFPIGTANGQLVSILYPETVLESSGLESIIIDGVGKVNRFDNPLICFYNINKQNITNETHQP